MLIAGREKLGGSRVAPVCGDSLRLPFADDSFDGATMIDRAARAQLHVARLTLDERLECVVQSRQALADAGEMIVPEAVRETGQTVRFARREFESALQLMEAMPRLADSASNRLNASGCRSVGVGASSIWCRYASSSDWSYQAVP